MDQPRRSPQNVHVLNPFECRMWAGHPRLQELITEESCRDEIASFLQHGQKSPVLGRPLRGDSRYRVELIYGARRLFVAQHLNAGLLVDLQDMNDRQAFIEADIENRLRADISPYERGIAYKDWLRRGYFDSQQDIAVALGVSAAQVSRLLRFAELPAVVVRAFGNHVNMKEAWAIALADRCKDPQIRQKITSVARSLSSRREEHEPAEIFRLLLDCEDLKRRSRVACRDTVIRSADGNALFRISYRNNEVHIVLPRTRARSETIEELSRALKELIERHSAAKSPAGRLTSSGAGARHSRRPVRSEAPLA